MGFWGGGLCSCVVGYEYYEYDSSSWRCDGGVGFDAGAGDFHGMEIRADCDVG